MTPRDAGAPTPWKRLRSDPVGFFLANAHYGLLLAILAASGSVFPVDNTDFTKGYLSAGRAVLAGAPLPYEGVAGFVNLPLFSVLFAPFALFSDYQAGMLFWASQIAAYLLAYHLIVRRYGTTAGRVALLFLLFATCKPFFVGLVLGQTSVWAFVMLIGCFVAHADGRAVAAGALLSLMFIVKVPLGLLFFYFLAKGEYRTVLASMGTFIAFVLASVLIFGFEPHLQYLDEVWLGNASGVIPGRYNQSIQALPARFVVQDMHDYSPVEPGPAGLGAALIVTGVFLVAIARALFVGRGSTSEARKAVEFSLCLVFANWATPLVWEHYLVFFLVAIASVWMRDGDRATPTRPVAGLLGACWVLINFPYQRIWESWGTLEGAGAAIYPWVISTPFLGSLVLTLLLLDAHRRLVLPDPVTAVAEAPRAG